MYTRKKFLPPVYEKSGAHVWPGRTGNEREGVGAEKGEKGGEKTVAILLFSSQFTSGFLRHVRLSVGRSVVWSPLSARLWWVAWWLNP